MRAPSPLPSPISETDPYNLRQEVNSLREALAILETKNKQKSHLLAAEMQRAQNLQTDLDRMVIEVSRLSESNDNLRRVLNDTMQQRDARTETEQEQKRRIDAMGKDLYRLSKGKEQLEKQIEELVVDLDHWKLEAEKGKQAKEEVEGLRNKNKEIDRTVAEWEKEITRLRKKDGDLEALKAELQRSKDALSRQAAESKEQASRIESLDTRLAELTAENVDLREELEVLKAKREDQENTLVSSVALTAEMEERYRRMNADLDAAQAENAKLLRMKAKYEAHSAEAEKVYNELRDIAELDRKRLAAITTQLNERSEAFEGARQEVKTLRLQLEALKVKSAERISADDVKAITSELESLRTTNLALVQQLRDSQMAEQSLKERIEDLCRSDGMGKGDKKGRLREAAQVELQLRAALTGKQGEIENLTEEVLRKEGEIRAVTEQYEALLQRNMELQMQLATSLQ
ncbi:hypothetical protein HDV00_000012 [Rhizophlyctis rosea]|nr:hypothetical protein HDV00_000012 [Rhizophlyctis rosea]